MLRGLGFLFPVALMTVGCQPQETIKESMEEYILLGVNYTQPLEVTLQHKYDGWVVKQKVDGDCSTWNIDARSTWRLPTTYWRAGDINGVYVETSDRVFCGS